MPSVTRPLRKDAERNRQRILEVAREVFAERGLSASLDDIAHGARVGIGTVYRRFPDKEALIDALFEERVEAFAAVAQQAADREDAWEGFVWFMAEAGRMQAADRGLKELLLSTSRGRARVTGVRDRIAPIVGTVVARAQAAGALRNDLAAQDIPLLNLMLGTVADAARETSPELWTRYLRIVLDGLRAAPAPPTALPVDALDSDALDVVMQAWRPPPQRRTPAPDADLY